MSLLLLTLERELLLAHIRTGCSAVKASESPKPMLQSSLRFYHVEFQNRERVWRPHVCSVCFRWKWRSPPPTTRAGSWAFVVFLSRPSSVIQSPLITQRQRFIKRRRQQLKTRTGPLIALSPLHTHLNTRYNVSIKHLTNTLSCSFHLCHWRKAHTVL